ncbi:MAG: amidohydrolase [Candidatus Cloacimonetes bacterium]|nr:amidohydrolase [Candidatus Cloacimonadota bacterium]
MDLKSFRHQMHRYPELSGTEEHTAARICEQLRLYHPDALYERVGGYGVMAVFEGDYPGKTFLLRADMDALPITEISDISYKSVHPGVAHLCGHDGHTAILLDAARRIESHRSQLRGRVVLLFQPAEETGTGALAVIHDPVFQQFSFDYAFGLHNLPGYPLGRVVVRDGTFASASSGCVVHFMGTESHAGHPEEGNSPLPAMMQVVQDFDRLSASFRQLSHPGFITIIHLRLGDVAFGTSPGKGVIMATFRAEGNWEMEQLCGKAGVCIQDAAKEYGLGYKIEWVEQFAATENAGECVAVVRDAAVSCGFPLIRASHPFSWSEDFSGFAEHIPSCFFGLGAGESHPGLHHENYDFPDELIEIGGRIFEEILKKGE